MKVHCVIPWLTTQGSRISYLHHILFELRRQFALSERVHHHSIQIDVNGANSSACARHLEVLVGARDLRVSNDDQPSKVPAVRRAAEVALSTHADALLVVDNDVLLRSDSILTLLEALWSSTDCLAIGAKAPLVTPSSTSFQIAYSYGATASFIHRLHPKNPTGSLYGLSPEAALTLPLDANEGDVLASYNIELSGAVVFSPYPATLDEEVRRRTRLIRASRAIGFERLHTSNGFLTSALTMQLPASVCAKRYRRSLRLWAEVAAAAENALATERACERT